MTYSSNEIRKMFLDYYQSKGHTVIPSASLLPNEDESSLLFTVAGMVPLKNTMLGIEKRPYTRATSSQKCLRAGGKQNDLDNVGYTARHHTFFEMLGNFSFGDYFKEGAITFAWELLTKVFELPKDKLVVTVHYSDDEAAKLWTKIAGIPDNEIIRLGKDNFWAMGDTGPCGPCSEIFYDYGDSVWGGKPGTPEEDGDRYVEIYNNVFMQNVREVVGGELKELSQKNIDTGMGLERFASVMQGKTSNYDTDTFISIKEFASDIFKTKITEENKVAFNVCADHIRAVAFAIADGITPSNESRGYVIRKIIRRAMRYINSLGINEAVFYKLTDIVEQTMGKYYTELSMHKDFIKTTIQTEENAFIETMQRGLAILNEEKGKLSKGQKLSGEIAFKLYDTYGFPLDMTQDALRRDGFEVDEEGFEKEMEHQKEMSKGAGKLSKSKTGLQSSLPKPDIKALNEIKDKFGQTTFTGYEKTEDESKVISVIKHNYTDIIEVILDKTPFYGEAGGQIGDTGVFELNNEVIAQVIDTKKPVDGVFVHYVKMTNKDIDLKQGDIITTKIDANRRFIIAKNHSCAHLLQSALIDTLGNHIKQKGSYTCEDYGRFDFANPRALTYNEILAIEEKVNSYIKSNSEITKTVMPIEEARKTGAIAPFDEKYGDMVRIVKMGDISIEFCGGTHLNNTSEVDCFILEKEESIASGIRRITYITGPKALERLKEYNVSDVKEYRKALKEQEEKALKEQEAKKQAEKEEQQRKQQEELNTILKSVKEENVKDILFIHTELENISSKSFKMASDEIKKQHTDKPVFVSFISLFEGKVSMALSITDNLKEKLNLQDLIKELAPIIGGKSGGGIPTFVSCGGTDFTKSNLVVDKIKEIIDKP